MPATTIAPATLSWACLNLLTKKRYDYLIETFGGLDEAWKRLDRSLLQVLGCKAETIQSALKQKGEMDLEEERTFLEEEQISLLTIDFDAYPETLRTIPDPPVFLFAKGNLDLLREPAIAIVGTRRMSAYGRRVIEHLVPGFVHAGLVTVSGLAIGIDAQVARETLRTGGRTIAVLGHGLRAIYPKANAELSEEIVANDGLLLTEYPPTIVHPDRFTFPERNRIIAGISLGTIVAEAASQSGSLITASLALEDGREIFAVPGQIFDKNYEGTHQLIAKGGAKLIFSATDVLQELGMVVPEKASVSQYRAQTPEEQTLHEHLTGMPQTVDDLVGKTDLPASVLNATLTLMELKGGAKNVGMGQWIRCPALGSGAVFPG